jgi:hypothetical protein
MTQIKVGDKVRLNIAGKRYYCKAERSNPQGPSMPPYRIALLGDKVGVCTYVERPRLTYDDRERVHIRWSDIEHFRLLPEHLTLVESSK